LHRRHRGHVALSVRFAGWARDLARIQDSIELVGECTHHRKVCHREGVRVDRLHQPIDELRGNTPRDQELLAPGAKQLADRTIDLGQCRVAQTRAVSPADQLEETVGESADRRTSNGELKMLIDLVRIQCD